MTAALPRGGKSGKSVAPRKTVYKAKKAPAMWENFWADCREFRKSKGMTIKDVAEAMGVSIALLSNWERMNSTPHPHDLMVYLETIGAKRLTVE